MSRIGNSLIFLTTLLFQAGCGTPESSEQQTDAKAPGGSAAPLTSGSDKLEVAAADSSELTSDANRREVKKPEATLHGIRFASVAKRRGLDHKYQTGASGELLMVESIGGGLGWIDFQNDGLPDLFCVQGGTFGENEQDNESDQLFAQNVDGSFLPVSEQAAIDERAYGQGVSIGDFNEDGFDDIFVTNVGPNQLWQNNGDGTFRLVEAAGVSKRNRWSSSAAWADADLDGDLDLYVCNYLKYDPYNPFPCEKDGLPALCHPRQIDAWPDEYFRNNSDGTFSEISQECGLSGKGNKALGVVITDLSQDGYPDVYVANDTTANFYFVNQQDGTFVESSLRLGGGLNAAGAMQASMGIAAGDYDRNGMIDIFLTHFTGESNTLYQNLGPVGLHDVSGKSRLFPVSMPKLGFGTVMSDFDRNGSADLIVANGHIDSNNADGDGFMQCAQVLTFDGSRWNDVSRDAADYFSIPHVGRGVALCDFDSDGDPDIAVANQNESLELLQNESDSGSWLKVIPVGFSGNRSSIGLSVVATRNDESWTEVIAGGTSFGSSHQHVIFLGFGDCNDSATVDLKVNWPNGNSDVLEGVELNQSLIVREQR